MMAVKPYTAVGLIPTVRGIRKREDIQLNLEHMAHMCKAAAWLSSLDLPVRLIALPEGALQAFNDEVLDLDHVQYARECAIDLPGPETEALGALAIKLTPAQLATLDQAFPHGVAAGARYPEAQLAHMDSERPFNAA